MMDALRGGSATAADPNARASLRKALHGADDERLHEYRNVSVLGWGARFHDQSFVDPSVLAMVEARGGRP